MREGFVMPLKMGIEVVGGMDSRLRGNDNGSEGMTIVAGMTMSPRE